MTQDQVAAFGGTRITIGLSAIIKVVPSANQISTQMKIFSGGGTLEVVPLPIALSGSSAAGWGIGYPIGASEVMNIGGPATFYLAATGATMVAALVPAFTSGVTLRI